MSNPEHDTLDALVAGADPTRAYDPGSDAELSPILSALCAGVPAASGVRAGGRKRRRLMITGVVAAGTLALGGTAVASGVIPLHTGQHGRPGLTESDTSEFLRMDSPELPAAIDRYGRGIPLPPGGDWSFAKRVLPAKVPTQMQVTGLKATLALQSACQWDMYWLNARARHHSPQVRAAQRTLDAIPTWKIIIATDGGGMADSFRQAAAAARHGDPRLVRQHVAANCDPAMWHPEGGR